jgi:hypothetical protein
MPQQMRSQQGMGQPGQQPFQQPQWGPPVR